MPMPTTRRGRYLYYRKRSIRRRNREYKRHPSGGEGDKRATCRQKFWTLWGKQEPKEYPRYVYGRPGTVGWDLHVSFTRPEKEVFGVLPLYPFFHELPEGPGHAQYAIVKYQCRRVWSIPSARQREWMPYLVPREALPPSAFYPLEKYPSGRRSYFYETFVP